MIVYNLTVNKNSNLKQENVVILHFKVLYLNAISQLIYFTNCIGLDITSYINLLVLAQGLVKS